MIGKEHKCYFEKSFSNFSSNFTPVFVCLVKWVIDGFLYSINKVFIGTDCAPKHSNASVRNCDDYNKIFILQKDNNLVWKIKFGIK